MFVYGSTKDLELLLEKYSKLNLKNPACIVDANHSNSGKKYAEQPRIVSSVLHSRSVNSEIANLVKGVMVESYLLPGSQKVNQHEYGKSVSTLYIVFPDLPLFFWTHREKKAAKTQNASFYHTAFCVYCCLFIRSLF